MHPTLTATTLFLAASLAAPSAQARPRPYVPAEEDTSLKAKCRSEASMVGGGGGRGAVTRAEFVREMRREYFTKCMHGGG